MNDLEKLKIEIEFTLSKEHGKIGTRSFDRVQAYEHVLRIIKHIEDKQI